MVICLFTAALCGLIYVITAHLLALAQPLAGALAILWLIASLHVQALIVGAAWSVLGILYVWSHARPTRAPDALLEARR